MTKSTLEEIEGRLLQGEFCQVLPDLRELVRKECREERVTPRLTFETNRNDLILEYFALATWECQTNKTDDDSMRILSDFQLLEKAILSYPHLLPFSTAAAWISLKTRPNAGKDELNDAQQLLERYLRQFALDAEATIFEVKQPQKNMYAHFVELLVCRVLPSLGLYESALSFVSKENSKEKFLDEDRRIVIENYVKEINPSLIKAKEQQRRADSQANANTTTPTEVPPPQQQTIPPPVSTTIPIPSLPISNGQSFVDEFERQRKQKEIEQKENLQFVGLTFAVVFGIIIAIRERKRVSGALNSIGDAVFGSG